MTGTLRALGAAGHQCVIVSPFDPRVESAHDLSAALGPLGEPHLVAAIPASIGSSIVRARRRGVPVSVARHTLDAVSAAVERVLSGGAVDLVHAEQLQALAQCGPARRRSLPVVLRAQNVESDLWRASGASWPLLRGLVRREAARLARYEGRAVREVTATVALTAADAERLRALSGRRDGIHHVPAPFPDRLPPASSPLPGEPAVVVLAGNWRPNRDGASWFRRTAWPVVRARCPGAVLHLFGSVRGGGGAPSIVVHESPLDSREAFAPGAILAVPLRVASGVRVKILEAWARGLPVVATPQAAAGLDASDGGELLIAADGPGFAAAVERLHRDRAFARASVEAGRALLRARHDPAAVASALVGIYADAVDRPAG